MPSDNKNKPTNKIKSTNSNKRNPVNKTNKYLITDFIEEKGNAFVRHNNKEKSKFFDDYKEILMDSDEDNESNNNDTPTDQRNSNIDDYDIDDPNLCDNMDYIDYEDIEMIENKNSKLKCPILPMKDSVFFPGMVAPLFVDSNRSSKILQNALENDTPILLLTQKNHNQVNITLSSLYEYGCLCRVIQIAKVDDNSLKVLVEGVTRAKAVKIEETNNVLTATINIAKCTIDEKADINVIKGMMRASVDLFAQYIKNKNNLPDELITNISNSDDPAYFTDTISAYLTLKISESQKLLEETDIYKRVKLLWKFLEKEIELLKTQNKIKSRVHDQLRKNQKEYYLNEQLKAIHKELGNDSDLKSEIAKMANILKKIKMPAEARKKAQAELKKLHIMPSISAEATVIRNYLDWVISLPWQNHSSNLNKSIINVEQELNKSHYGLNKVKEMITDQIAVQMRMGSQIKGSIICLVGPPGVGKTSLAKSIAQAVNRNFIRISLGGMRDESEIRGHRRTYIGAMPGRIIQALKKTKTDNPLILLDEIDKVGKDWRGDPSSALLEVLDPEQNYAFNDHYLELDYDLSKVFFIATANNISEIPAPLLDRMELIHLSGYTQQEKVNICKNYIIPRQYEKNGSNSQEINFADETIDYIIQKYTRESGVRALERSIASLIKRAIRKILEKKYQQLTIDNKIVNEFLGPEVHIPYKLSKKDTVGSCNGLAWTASGGDILSIETVMSFGRGNLKITGKLGETMQESVQTALSYIKSKAHEFGIKSSIFDRRDFHVHVPEGAIPKDGPSAGITIFTALLSLLTKIPVCKEIAMTGEITLTGKVLPIGGLKEKILAAIRYDIKTVIIPKENSKDLQDIPKELLKSIKIIAIDYADQLLNIALVTKPLSIEWNEGTEEKEFFQHHKTYYPQQPNSNL